MNNCKKMVKSVIFEVGNPLEIVPNLHKFRGKKQKQKQKTNQISRFLREKNP